ncbi:MAG: ATP-binding protein [Actinomycetota bacterium]|nr:ATP-binding protein [Actinomycetota bacterium]
MTEIELGLEVIRSYKRLSYTPWHALAEFVDNSTQAYFDNKGVLDAAYEASGGIMTVRIDYDPDGEDGGVLRISDNSIGMSLDDVDRAMRIGVPPADPTGRSRYGMGLKTAACWLGDYWTVRTSKLGIQKEVVVEVDVNRVASPEWSWRM